MASERQSPTGPVATVYLPGTPGIPSRDAFLHAKTDEELQQLAKTHDVQTSSPAGSSAAAAGFSAEQKQTRRALIERLKADLPNHVFPSEKQVLSKTLNDKPSDLAALRKIVVELCRGFVIVGCDESGSPPRLDDTVNRRAALPVSTM